MAKAKDIRIDQMVTVNPATDNQKRAFQEYKNDKNLFLYGAAGTGKTFITLFELVTRYSGNAAKPTPASTAKSNPITLFTFIMDFLFLLSCIPSFKAQSGL